MKTCRRLFTLLTITFLLLAAPDLLFAASTDETATTYKPTFEKLTGSADWTLRLRMTEQYNDIITFQNSALTLETRTKALQFNNEELLVGLRQQVKKIDATRIERLKLEAEETRKRHKPLLDLYLSLNNQADTASSLGGKKLASALRSQANLMKIPVQLARQDIKSKDSALKAAKDKAAQTAKKVRETLSGIDSCKIKIRAERSAATSIRTSFSAVWKAFKAAVKKNDVQATARSLPILVTLSRDKVVNLENQYKLESKISEILTLAKKQIP